MYIYIYIHIYIYIYRERERPCAGQSAAGNAAQQWRRPAPGVVPSNDPQTTGTGTREYLESTL